MNLVLVKKDGKFVPRSAQSHAVTSPLPSHNKNSTNRPNVFSMMFSATANFIPDPVLNFGMAITGAAAVLAIGQLALTVRNTQPISPAVPNYRQVTPSSTFAASIRSSPMSRANAAPITPAPIAAPVISAEPAAIDIPTAIEFAPIKNGILYLDVRDGYVTPTLSRPDQIRAMQYILQNEGCSSDAYTCSKDKVTISVGVNVSSNPELFSEVLNCDLETAQKIANRKINYAQLSPEANGALFAAKFNEHETILINKCKNKGVNFHNQPPRVKLALMDLCYIRPEWIDDEVRRMLRVGNYAELADKFARMSNKLANDHLQTGTAIRLAKAAILCFNATQNRGIPAKLNQENLSRWQIEGKKILQLAPPGVNPIAVPQHAHDNVSR